MSKYTKYYIVVLVLIVAFAVSFPFIYKKYLAPKENDLPAKKENFSHTIKENLTLDNNYRSANLCNDKVLYPIQQLGPDYGSTVNSNCPCTQFVRSP